VSRKAIGGFWRSLQQQLGELLGRVGKGEALAWVVVEFVGDGVELRLADGAEVGALGEVLPEQAVGAPQRERAPCRAVGFLGRERSSS
jgi:hypothetical protein